MSPSVTSYGTVQRLSQSSQCSIWFPYSEIVQRKYENSWLQVWPHPLSRRLAALLRHLMATSIPASLACNSAANSTKSNAVKIIAAHITGVMPRTAFGGSGGVDGASSGFMRCSRERHGAGNGLLTQDTPA